MSTNTLAAAIVGFLLGGLTVSVAAQLDDGAADSGRSDHGSSSGYTSGPGATS